MRGEISPVPDAESEHQRVGHEAKSTNKPRQTDAGLGAMLVYETRVTCK